MSTLTSLVKSGKRKIFKMKTEEPPEREQNSRKAQQAAPESTVPSASERNYLGQPDPSEARNYLGRSDPSEARNFLGRPDPSVSQDATRAQ